MVRRPVQSKDFAICIETDDPTEFISLNPNFVMSDSLGAPYRYLGPAERGMELVSLGAVAIPAGVERLALSARPWANRATSDTDVIALAVVAVADAGAPRIEHVFLNLREAAA